VQVALAAGRLDPERLASWRKLQQELSFLHRKQDKRAESEERRRWRALNREFRQRDRLRP
jgi:ribosome biogenesis GTPase